MATIRSEMAGTLIELTVKVGDSVQSGQQVAIVESMKMEVPLLSPVVGTVTQLLKAPGDFLNEGDSVIELK